MNPNELNELIKGRVLDGKIRAQDAKLFHEFINEYSVLNNLRDRSILKWVFGFSGLCRLLYAHLDKCTDELADSDAITFIRALQSSKWAEETRATRWKQWTGYMRWLNKRHGPLSPKCQELFVDRDAKYSYKVDANKVERKDVPEREEVLRIAGAESYESLKTFYMVLFEGGLPFEEGATLRFKDMVPYPNGRGYTVHVREAKNRVRIRSIPLVEVSVGYIDRWMKLHPTKEPDALLFMLPDGQPLQNATINKRLGKIAKGLGIRKHITVHCFRHARATELCTVMTEFELNKFFGWVQGSKQPARYIRNSGIDLRRKLMHAYGFESQDKPKHLDGGRACPRCAQFNAQDATRCDVCAATMDPQEYRRLQLNIEEQEQLVERLIKEKWKAEWENFRQIVAKEDVNDEKTEITNN